MRGNARGQASIACNAPQIRAVLVKRIVEATERANEASEVFNTVIDQTPSGLPHPDGTQRIRNASRELDIARTEIRMKAHTRLNEFVEHGIVPDDETEKCEDAKTRRLWRSLHVRYLSPTAYRRAATRASAFSSRLHFK